MTMINTLRQCGNRGRRWSRDNWNFGPFTISRDSNRYGIGIELDSGGDGEDHSRGCHLMLRLFGWAFFVELPAIVKPHVERVTAGWDAATIARMGRDWYNDVDPCRYGFAYSFDIHFLQVYRGRTTNDSTTDTGWCCHPPFTQWRLDCESLYGRNGECVWFQSAAGERQRKLSQPSYDKFEAWRTARDKCPKVRFLIDDSDGTQRYATTHIEQREYLLGERSFKWLSLFARRRVHRSLSINFDGEVGPEKGSWKGGLVGTSIEMQIHEQHVDAFMRWCDQDHRAKYGNYRVRFVGEIAS